MKKNKNKKHKTNEQTEISKEKKTIVFPFAFEIVRCFEHFVFCVVKLNALCF